MIESAAYEIIKEEGREEGRKEGDAKRSRETATNLLNLGFLTEAQIADVTALSVEAVRALKKEMDG